jgi:hypothetical protein
MYIAPSEKRQRDLPDKHGTEVRLTRLIPLTQVTSTTGLTSDWAAADGEETPWFRWIGDRVIARQ